MVVMVYYGAAAEPYQEVSWFRGTVTKAHMWLIMQQAGSDGAAASPDDLRAFYAVMQKQDVERKMSRRKSSGIWSRKSVKRSAAQPAHAGPSSQPPSRPPPSSLETSRASPAAGDARDMDKQEEQRDIVTPLSFASRSIIPEALAELPSWYPTDDSLHKMRYNLHNPVGPRRYFNHHLIPPSHKKPSSRPSSIFSPSFPPMATSPQDSDDLTRLPGPSRTPSNSPLPTPSSSQTRVGDAGKPRSRKTSQNATDGVDLLDLSDPWGTNWHHQSPYDVGLTGPVAGALDGQEVSNFLDASHFAVLTPLFVSLRMDASAIRA